MHNQKVAPSTDQIVQHQMDSFLSPLIAPVTKLDADQYIAEDLDGVTESLSGSGNLNFLIMQGNQKNAAAGDQGGLPFPAAPVSLDSGFLFSGAHYGGDGYAVDAAFAPLSVSSGQSESEAAVHNSGALGTGGVTHIAQSSALSVDSASGAPQSGGGLPLINTPLAGQAGQGTNGRDGVDGQNGADGQSGADGQNGIDGSNGSSGSDGSNGSNGSDGSDGSNGANGNDGQGGGHCIVCDPGDTTIINIVVENIIHLGDIINIGDINLGDIHLGDINLGDINLGDINLGDININLGDITLIDLGDLTDIICIGNITDLLDLGDVTDLVTVTVETVLDTVNGLLDGANITDGLLGLLDGGDGLTLEIGTVVSDLLDLDLAVISGDTVFHLVDQVIDLNPVLDLLDPIAALPVADLLDLGGIVTLLGEGGHEHRGGDTDVALGLDLGVVDIPLVNGVLDIAVNPVEDILGDIDLLADAPVKLFDTHGIDNAQGDTDLSLDLGLGLTDLPVLGGTLDIPLDPLEAILGDIDLDTGLAVNILGDIAEPLVDGFAGGSAGDTLLSSLGDGLGGLVHELIAPDHPAPDVAAAIDLAGLGVDLGGLDIAAPLDLLEPVIGDVDLLSGIGLDLFNPAGTDNASGDRDIDLDLDLGVLGLGIGEIDFIDVPLDPVEAILGDIDLTLDFASNLLAADCDDNGILDLNGGGAGGTDLLAWTESLVCNPADLFGQDGLGALSAVLPEPVGHVAEGLGGLLGSSEGAGGLLGNSLGGLFG